MRSILWLETDLMVGPEEILNKNGKSFQYAENSVDR